jgi:hypothetical protein
MYPESGAISKKGIKKTTFVSSKILHHPTKPNVLRSGSKTICLIGFEVLKLKTNLFTKYSKKFKTKLNPITLYILSSFFVGFTEIT